MSSKTKKVNNMIKKPSQRLGAKTTKMSKENFSAITALTSNKVMAMLEKKLEPKKAISDKRIKHKKDIANKKPLHNQSNASKGSKQEEGVASFILINSSVTQKSTKTSTNNRCIDPLSLSRQGSQKDRSYDANMRNLKRRKISSTLNTVRNIHLHKSEHKKTEIGKIHITALGENKAEANPFNNSATTIYRNQNITTNHESKKGENLPDLDQDEIQFHREINLTSQDSSQARTPQDEKINHTPHSLNVRNDLKDEKEHVLKIDIQQIKRKGVNTSFLARVNSKSGINIPDLFSFNNAVQLKSSYEDGNKSLQERYDQTRYFNTTISKNKENSSKKRKVTESNDNYVKLDLKNKFGSYREKNNVKLRPKSRSKSYQPQPFRYQTKPNLALTYGQNTGIDPLDDFVDGVHEKKNSVQSQQDIPKCSGHGIACILRTVKSNQNGNKGREYYTCAFSAEKCNFFQWKEDSDFSIQQALLKSKSESGFTSRQIEFHKKGFLKLTIPELKLECTKRGLSNKGKKMELVLRLVVWTRSQVTESLTTNTQHQKTHNLHALSPTVDTNTPKNSNLFDQNEDEDYILLSDDSETDEVEEEGLHIVSSKTKLSSNPTREELLELLFHYYGYQSFRNGQEWAIRRCLLGKRSLLVAPTSIGKSLCYTLSAAILPGLVVVVSPLISIIEDQLRLIPPNIPATTLSGSLSQSQVMTVLDDIRRNRIKIIFVSPERLTSMAFKRFISAELVSCLCIDEAHCISQFGHHFRPSYLRIKGILQHIKPKSVLALTATASGRVIEDICNTLHINAEYKASFGDKQTDQIQDINEDMGVKKISAHRDNINPMAFIVENEEERRHLLFQILQGQSSSDTPKGSNKYGRLIPELTNWSIKKSFIIYVWRQHDAEVIAEQLVRSNVAASNEVVCYHAGMNRGDRETSQSKFLRGKARICVATVAFGLGVNKADVDAVIHISLPSSLEHYIQEIGRAGRDGRQAKAISLVIKDDFITKTALSYSHRICMSQILAVLNLLHELLNDAVRDSIEDGYEDNDNMKIAFPISSLGVAIDCKDEGIETIISLLEDSQFCKVTLVVEGYVPDDVLISMKKRELESLMKTESIAGIVKKCAVKLDEPCVQTNSEQRSLSMLSYSNQSRTNTFSYGEYHFSAIRCARRLGPDAQPRHVYASLRRLQSCGEIDMKFTNNISKGRGKETLNSSIFLTMNRSVLHILNDDIEKGKVASAVLEHLQKQEETSTNKVKQIYKVVTDLSNITESKTNIDASPSNVEEARKSYFQNVVNRYFEDDAQAPPDLKEFEPYEDVDLDEGKITSELTKDVFFLLNDAIFQSSNVMESSTSHLVGLTFGGKEHMDFTSLCITKFLFGIMSTRFAPSLCYSHPLWGRWKNRKFELILSKVQALLG